MALSVLGRTENIITAKGLISSNNIGLSDGIKVCGEGQRDLAVSALSDDRPVSHTLKVPHLTQLDNVSQEILPRLLRLYYQPCISVLILVIYEI